MRTHNICLNGEIITKYPPYLFHCVDPYQTAPEGAFLSGSTTLFAIPFASFGHITTLLKF